MIKKYFTSLIALALAALSMASCLQNEPALEQTEPVGNGIVLTLDTGEMQLYTKAQPGERPGDEDAGTGTFNENLISGNAQIFFFAPGADENTPARWNIAYPVTGTTIAIDVTMADLAEIFGRRNPQAGDMAEVMVVCNYDGETAFTLSTKKYTKKEIKEMPLKRADLSKHPQDYFVMLSDVTPITLIDPKSLTPAKGTVKLRRRAAKVTFRLTIAEEIAVENYAYSTDTDGNITATKSIEIWAPQINNMTVYSQYFMKDGVLGGMPTVCPTNKESAMLFTGVDNPYKLVETTDKIERTRRVFRKNDQGQYIQDEDGNYVADTTTVEVPLFVTKYNDGDDNPANDINGPFYSYPVTWGIGEETEPFLKLIIPWKSGKDGRVKYYYYKIPFQVESLDANHWYEVTLDVQILGGEEQLPVPLNANYHVVDWEPGADAETNTVSARYLSVPVKSFTLYNKVDLEIPMISSHPCEIVNVTVTKPYYGSGTAPTYSASDLQRLEVEGLDAIEFLHNLNNATGRNQDVAPYTIKFRVRQIDDTDYYADVTIVQYPAIYIEKQDGGNVFVDGYYTLVTGGRPDNSANTRTSGGVTYYYHGGSFNPFGDGTRITPYGNLNGGTAATATIPTSEKENTIIHVTAFGENSDTYTFNNQEKPYIIGDPRIPFMQSTAITNKTMTNYLTPGGSNNNTTAWTQDQLNALMVGTEVDNIIAPAFMFASEFGRQGTGESSFETVAHRCATYQEAGYPAGRWRLPTQAEVAFCANLQANGFIGTLFATGRYWISNGNAISISGSNVNHQNTGNSTRCVYDIWYWGAEPVADPDYMYTVMP